MASSATEEKAASAGIEARTQRLAAIARAISFSRSSLASSRQKWEVRNIELAGRKDALLKQTRLLRAAAGASSSQQSAQLQHLCLSW